MNKNERKRAEPPDTAKFNSNRWDVPGEKLAPYQGKYVAWSPDGRRILACGATEEEMDQNLAALGIPLSQVVREFIDLEE